MTKKSNSNTNAQADKASEEILEVISDPTMLKIIVELIKNPNQTSKQLKKTLNLKGSRIFYFLKKLIERNILNESEIENPDKKYEHLNTRVFNVSSSFIKDLSVLQKEGQFQYNPERGHRKLAHLFQLNYAIATLQNELRILEHLSDKEYDEYINNLNTPHRWLFFTHDKAGMTELKEFHKKFSEKNESENYFESIRNSTHIALLGLFSLTQKSK